jgi:antitoxin HicB
MIAYPAKFTAEEGAFTVTFPDIPEAITCGYSAAEAMEYAEDALVAMLSIYMERKKDIPKPSELRGKQMRIVRLPALQEAKLSLYQAMRDARVRKADLARRLGWQKSQVDRLLNLKHASRLDQIEQALAALRKRLVIAVEDAA